ncbi:SDR family NAD(P)-dependent oxidoreductase [Cellulomonas alba]|uniref:SDR family NAD(P)-dependent oxidoreductase n=1 Tax=Cellulomonas alba TaxID=3053467 RepID=A0ABT7SFM8_9CELL|nr:SDR family NAD(P)-dependent oxidoreductase [Cellulomonas alba]MDM7854998.1 SDR family NAD(P)-dependent oxidoreductase [Cellulomonas alba]
MTTNESTPAARPLAGAHALLVGANGLIGNAVARLLVEAGARTTIAARDADALDALRTALLGGRPGAEVTVHAVDVRDDAAVADLVLDASGPDGLDVAVNNVGLSHRPAPLEQLDLAVIDDVLAVSLRGVLVCLRAELGAMADGGSIVNVASSAGLAAAPGMSAYVAAKHGVVGLTRTSAVDHAARGVRVNAVAPGPIESGPIMRLGAEERDHVGQHVPLRRMGSANEVAQAVVWLASPAASYITGTVLAVDGGKRAGGA